MQRLLDQLARQRVLLVLMDEEGTRVRRLAHSVEAVAGEVSRWREEVAIRTVSVRSSHGIFPCKG